MVHQREVRLKPEFAPEYPDMPPGVWMPAAELARKLIERAYAGRREGRHTRTFDPTHFEFRGGDTGRRLRTRRTRSTDPRIPPSLKSPATTIEPAPPLS
jgi:hypothetical protein